MDRGVEVVPGLDLDLLQRIASRIDELEPAAIAVVVTGSMRADGTLERHLGFTH